MSDNRKRLGFDSSDEEEECPSTRPRRLFQPQPAHVDETEELVELSETEEQDVHRDKAKANPVPAMSRGLKMMQSMGFQVGQRLGTDPKRESALLEPIVATRHTGKMGIKVKSAPVTRSVTRRLETDTEAFRDRVQLQHDRLQDERDLEQLKRVALEICPEHDISNDVTLPEMESILRSYYYCLYCGTQYTDSLDMELCPGAGRECHG